MKVTMKVPSFNQKVASKFFHLFFHFMREMLHLRVLTVVFLIVKFI